MFGGCLLAGEEYRLVVGEVHSQELLLLQRLHQRRLRGTNGKVQYWPAFSNRDCSSLPILQTNYVKWYKAAICPTVQWLYIRRFTYDEKKQPNLLILSIVRMSAALSFSSVPDRRARSWTRAWPASPWRAWARTATWRARRSSRGPPQKGRIV